VNETSTSHILKPPGDADLPGYAVRLRNALLAEFGGEAEAERTGTGDRCRFAVVSPRFEGVEGLDQQDMAWDVAERVLDRKEVVQVTLILTYAPSELDTPIEV
jgi:hypothetical protein